MQYTAGSIAKQLQGEVTGNPDVEVTRLCKLDESEVGGLAFLANTKYENYLYDTQAAAVLVTKDFKPQHPVTATLIHVNDPYTAFTQLLGLYQAAKGYTYKNEGIHPTAVINENVAIAEKVTVGAHTVVCAGVTIGQGSLIGSQVFIGDNCSIGENCVLHPGVKIYHGTVLGSQVVVHSNTVIGSDGFGFAPQADGTFAKIPQIGSVVIGNDVEIGANTVIDRATMGSTKIGNGVKLDNLIQIAHNVEVGANCVIASQTGISGSTKVGPGCHIGGQVGIAGHLNIAAGTQLAARSGVLASINEPGKQWAGAPVQPFKDWLRSNVILRQLAKRDKR